MARSCIERTVGERIDYLRWMLLAPPFALLSSLLAALPSCGCFEADRDADFASHLFAGPLARRPLVIAPLVLETVGRWYRG